MTSASFHNDLPTLEQVLTRKTQPPVCLYNLYIIMRDRLHMEEVLDFYLDVQHHELLWRRYVKTMRRSGYLTEEDLADGFQSPRVLSRLSQAILNRHDLTDSAHRILLRYLVPSASKELTQLPPELKATMRRQLEDGGRDDPLVFTDGKEYLFEYMRRNAYPKFLRLKVWGNLTLWQQMLRLVIGLVALLAGLTVAFSLIFLGYPQWGVRFWVSSNKLN
ncbi:hypothetical protein BDB00DRAFT_885040 [Zychaea mexicana]|uniref:uncharacterized protein n=1 Tax=Zychaea mexicana TaxID=64656 RepID=UPI0022FE9EA4|nr:uncharacterized protein BDB00DRAFT_885040 [Zychaea mexicana]KAI9487935.1 hypothetical protein BDB00DRAFT_885040 [Zychaea mexicana]